MAKKKKLGALATKISERQFIGPEPAITGIPSKSQLIAYYNWCNTRYELGDAKDYMLTYLEEKKQDTKGIRSLPDYCFTTIGFTARFLLSGGTLPVDAMERFNSKISALYDRSPSNESVTSRTSSQVVTDRMQEACIFLDRIYDQVLVKKEFDHEMTETLKNGIVTKKVAEAMLPQYHSELKEMELALSGKDQEVAEGYTQYTKSELRGLTSEIHSFINEVEKFLATSEPKQKTPRKQRVPRVKPPGKQVAKLQFMSKDDKYNIKSIDPHQIIGANELWLFNTEYRKLSVLRASDEKGLSVKGTTVYGFDEKSSFSKRIRKPEQILPQIMNGGKVAIRKTFESLKTQQVVAKGRCGGDTLLMRVFK